MKAEDFIYEQEMLKKLRQRYKEAKSIEEKNKIKAIGQQKKYELMVKFDKFKRDLIEKYPLDYWMQAAIRELINLW